MKLPNFEVVIVGGGLAGLTAAYALARDGVKVLVIERGEYPGAKNVFGGILYTRIWEQFLPGLLADAPLEREVTNYVFVLISGHSSVCLQFSNHRDEEKQENGYTVLRSRFDRWLAQKVEEVGARILGSTVARGLILQEGKVAGVRVDGQHSEIHAKAVILAEGVNGLITRRLGMGASLTPDQLAISAKEVLMLPEKTIDERFNIWGGRGTAYTCLGVFPGHLPGGGFLYTNRDTLSVGVVAHLDAIKNSDLDVPRLLAIFKELYPIKDLIRGAVTKEYSAHLIPEAGLHMQPSLVADGLLVTGDAAGFAINTGYALRGSDLAVASGLAAAQTLREAMRGGDLSKKCLSSYLRHLEAYGLVQDLRSFSAAPLFFKNPRLYETYPDVLCTIMERLVRISPRPHQGLFSILHEEVRSKIGWRKVIWDGIQLLKSI